MPTIFVKLNTATSYVNERLDFQLPDLEGYPAGPLDYTNIDEDLQLALNSQKIKQITESEYYSILANTLVEAPLDISTNYLITLNTKYPSCPPDAASFFIYYQNKFYKILWGDLKNCLVGSIPPILFTVGLATDPYPQPGMDSFILPSLVGASTKNMQVTIGGVEIYAKEYYLPEDWPQTDYYELDSLLGKITRPATFKYKDIVAIRQV